MLIDQGSQCAARIDVAAPVGEVRTGEQYLRHGTPVQGEDLLVDHHKSRLTDGSQHLFGRQPSGQVWEAQLLPSCCDGSRRNQDHLVPGIQEMSDLARQLHDQRGRDVPCPGGQRGGPDLDYDAHEVLLPVEDWARLYSRCKAPHAFGVSGSI